MDTPCFASAGAAHGDYVIVADGTEGTLVVNFENPSSPQSVAALPTASSVLALAVQGDYGYLADERAGSSLPTCEIRSARGKSPVFLSLVFPPQFPS